MRIFIFLFVITLGFSVFASDEQAPVRAFLAYGSEYRPERDLENRYVGHSLVNYSLGTQYKEFLVLLETAQFKEESGNATLNVTRVLEDTMIWVQHEREAWKKLIPYLGMGVGAYREIVTTNLAGANSATRATNYKAIGGFNFGLRLDVPWVWLSAEARLLVGEELDQQPTLGALFRAGIHF